MPPPRVLFLGLGYAGHRTRFLNLRAHVEHDPRIRPTFRMVSGWNDTGLIERLPYVPVGLKGRVRAVAEAAPLASLPRPDVIWLGAGEAVTPYLWAQYGRLRRPLVKDADAIFDQLNDLAPIYSRRPSRRGVHRMASRLLERLLWRSVTLFTPWSNWVADALRQKGIRDEHIRVLPPGVNLEQWRPRPELRRERRDGPLRLLFVGADFTRKGGPLLADVFRSRFAERCELDIVTRAAVQGGPGVRVHQAEPNSPALRELYARADLFVLPTQAECFGIATVEALASGLPVVVSDLGGARDIVDPAKTGWLIEPTAEALVRALEEALDRRADLPQLGVRARQVAQTRFDGRRNDDLLVELLLDQAARFRQSRSDQRGSDAGGRQSPRFF